MTSGFVTRFRTSSVHVAGGATEVNLHLARCRQRRGADEEWHMSRSSITLLVLLAFTVVLTLFSHSHLAQLFNHQPNIVASTLRPMPPISSLLPLLSALSPPTAAALKQVLTSPLCTYTASHRFPPYDPLDFREQSVRLRSYAEISNALVELDQDSHRSAERNTQLYAGLSVLGSYLERHLFPWSSVLKQSLYAHFRNAQGRGIVMTTGPEHYRYAILNIRHLIMIGSRLPIEMWIASKNDLPIIALQELNTLNVTVRIMNEWIDTAQLQLSGFAYKPFALLLSSFEEALLLDSDAYFVQDPMTLFDDPYYQAQGALFFPDSTFPPARASEKQELLRRMWPKEADVPYRVAGSRFYKGESLFEQESSVVVVHRRQRTIGLLGVALLNQWPARDYVYRHVWGDKETFWLGFALANEPYDFSPHSPAIIGYESPGNKGVLCGHMAHPDHNGNLLYWNGGIAPDKAKADLAPPITFSAWGAPEKWLGPGQCTHPVQAKPLTDKERRVIEALLSMWRIQQRERDRISGFQMRVFFAMVLLVCVLAMCVCLALVCCACFANKSQRSLHIPQSLQHQHLSDPEIGQVKGDGGHESDDEEHKAEYNMWHRP